MINVTQTDYSYAIGTSPVSSSLPPIKLAPRYLEGDSGHLINTTPGTSIWASLLCNLVQACRKVGRGMNLR